MPYKTVTVIRPRKSIFDLGLSELWAYRDLLYFLVLKELKVRYRQTILRIGWSVLPPLGMMLVFTIIFGNIAKLPSEGLPYAVFSYSGLILWSYFSSSLSRVSGSLNANAGIFSKVYIPRLLFPISACIVNLVDYAIAFSLLFVLLAYFGIFPSLWIILFLLPLFLTMLLALGLGLWISTAGLKYRDVLFASGFFVSLLLYLSPIIYPSSMIGGNYFSLLININPMTSLINMQRLFFLGVGSVNLMWLGSSILIIMTILVSGLLYFKAREGKMVDVI